MRTTRHFQPRIVLSLVLMGLFITASPQQENTANQHPSLPLPELLRTTEGLPVSDKAAWEDVRRGEILELFREHMYGYVPESGISVHHVVKYMDRNALGGKAVMKEVEVQLSNGVTSHHFSILLFLPADAPGPVPVFLGMNFRGNQTILADHEITISDQWVNNDASLGVVNNRATNQTRGSRSSRWPVDLILEKGFGLATIYCGEIDPDFDDGFHNGVHALFPEEGGERDPSAWGTISTWAWGLSRAMDYLETDPEVDPHRVAVIGHSRLGKTALWAGAQDERFALVISNDSGCGGAALSGRKAGETVSRINTVFPYWFASRFHDYNDHEEALPVDQHMLMALVAPRPLYVASAAGDEWADPYGEYLSLYYGSKVYPLYGYPALKSDRLPAVDQPVQTGQLGYHIRSGNHDITRYDWEQYLDFASKHMGSGSSNVSNNPVTEEWIAGRIRKSGPRIILTPELEKIIKGKLSSGDALTVQGLHLLKLSAESVLTLDPLVRKMTGRRLLGVSRECIYRLTTLALAYRLEKDERFLRKLEEEMTAVSQFEDWNPSHFLDVAEMATGVALALDWAGEWISPEVKLMAREAIVEKALIPGSGASPETWWRDSNNNWNLVCNGGLSLAAIAVYEDVPELATKILKQAVESIPLGLMPYAPGGIYPEGPSYWFYATTFLTASISAFESALGTDFGFTGKTGVMESAIFSQVTAGPSGLYYNYFDAGTMGYHNLAHFGLLAWFAARSGKGMDRESYLELLNKEVIMPSELKGTRFYSTFFLFTSELGDGQQKKFQIPEVWSGGGEEPVVIFRDSENDPGVFFLAAKGGRAADNHGNMDAGSFIFELDGVRWSVDPGNQDYTYLEEIMGGELWNSAQDSKRWSLLTKNNLGHSTLTVDGAMHKADARARLVKIDRRTGNPSAIFDMTPVFEGHLEAAQRTFIRQKTGMLQVRDQFTFSATTQNLTWQMMTRAEVQVEPGRIILKKDGKELFLVVSCTAPWEVKVVSLSPPPLSYDLNIPGLKRIEIRINRKAFPGDSGEISVKLTNQSGTML